MTMQGLRTTRRDEILRAAANRGARNIRVFGSVARG
jgi:predicted nucleotidyltransferase